MITIVAILIVLIVVILILNEATLTEQFLRGWREEVSKVLHITGLVSSNTSRCHWWNDRATIVVVAIATRRSNDTTQ